MTAHTLPEFIAASLLLALLPGPDILTVITRSVTQGTRAGLVAALGFASGLTFHTTLAGLGIAAALAAWPSAILLLRIFGAAYLLYLAIRTFFSRETLNLETSADQRTLRTIFAQSVLMNILNPKVTLFFLAFLPKFVDPINERTPAPPWLQLLMLGVVFALCTIVVFGACALAAGQINGWLRRQPGAGRGLRWAASAVFVLLAVWILIGLMRGPGIK